MTTEDTFNVVENDMAGLVIPCYVCGAPRKTVTQRDGATNCVFMLEHCSHGVEEKETVQKKDEKKPPSAVDNEKETKEGKKKCILMINIAGEYL